MVYDDYHLSPNAGRVVKEDGTLVNVADAISGDRFMANVSKMSKSAPVVVHNAIAASVTEANCTAIDVSDVSILNVACIFSTTETGTWDMELYGSNASDGTFSPCYDQNDVQRKISGFSADKNWDWLPVGCKYIKLVPTSHTPAATLTVYLTTAP